MPLVLGVALSALAVGLFAMQWASREPPSLPARPTSYPGVPTLKELGYDVTHSIWHAWMVPAGTPPAVVARLRQGLKAMVEDEAFKSLMTKLGERIQYMRGEDFEKWWDQDDQKVGALLRQLIKK
jgi:tripartite-type tricarboxylate transporter receptor subunit TctC